MINKSQILSFKNNGYVILRKYLSENKIKTLKREIELISQKHKIKNIFVSKKDLFWKKNLKRLDNLRLELNYNNKRLDNFFNSKLFYSDTSRIKKKKSFKFKVDKIRFNMPSLKRKLHPWHQDEITWPNRTNQNPITFWVPLVNIDKKNGIEFARLPKKSNSLLIHKYGKNPKTKLKYATFKNKKILNKTFKPELKIGDVIIFDAFLPHRSCLNITKKIRISIDTRFR